ncbi:MAG: GH3 auxin-responsive promoter family protein [Bacteroidetes bacterium]|nr:GH3 auxin-responsive promoter family protein [Bacteroidota bacterium]
MSIRLPTSAETRWPPALSPLAVIREFKENPIGTQVAVLRELMAKASRTEWGQRYSFGEIAQAKDPMGIYRERVPIHSYEAFRSDVERIRRGEPDVTWPGVFKHFAVSSGTASAGKIIPLSTEMLNINRRFTLAVALSYFEATADPSFFMGKLLSIPGRIEEDPLYPGNMIGEVSGLQFLFAPWAVKKFYQAVPQEILFLPNWENKLDAMVAHTLHMDIRAIAMVPSWAIVLFKKLITAHNKATGSNATRVHEIWPNLQVFFSGGVALSSYQALLEQQVGGPLDFMESYGASEGYVSFQDDPRIPDMLVHLNSGVYYEFEPVDGSGPRVSIEGVETGIRYRIFVSTCSGLWGYEIGDVVRFTSTKPYRLVVAGRTNEMLDKYGEAVYGDEARAALGKACELTHARISNFHITSLPVTSVDLPGHEWLIEFETEPNDLSTFARIIDDHLQEVNRHYLIRREAGAFQLPSISSLQAGTFNDWLKSTKKAVSAQTKVPILREEREIANALLKISGNNT